MMEGMLRPERLPKVRVLHVNLRAEEAALLPTLPTTTLHGALGYALRKVDPDAHRDLIEPPAAAGDLAGVTTRPPLPMVIAPRAPTGSRPFELPAGGWLSVRCVLMGEKACRHEGSLVAALWRLAESGLGRQTQGWEHARFSVAEFDSAAAWPADAPLPIWQRLELRLETPLRLKAGGRVVSSIDAEALWGSLLRRGDQLARCYGSGALVEGEPACPFEVLEAELRVQDVRRHSARQGRGMSWPGLLGRVTLGALAGRGEPGNRALELLRFVELAQLGKGTSFGFGRIKVKALALSGPTGP